MRARPVAAVLLGAWVLWENVTGILDARSVDFWRLRSAHETRADCLTLAERSLLRLMQKADGERPGWTRERDGAWSSAEWSSDGKSFVRRDLQCWPAGTDPRP